MTQPTKRFLIAAAAILALCLLLEVVFFQWDALSSRGLTPIALEIGAAKTERLPLEREESDVAAVMPSRQEAKPVYRTEVTFSDLEAAGIRTLSFVLSGDHQLIRTEIFLSDDAYRNGFASADSLPALPGEAAYARLEAHGTLHGLQIRFETEDETAALSEAMLNAPLPYRFSLLRFSLLLLPLLLAAAVLCFRLWQAPFRRERARHLLIYCLTAALCLGLVIAVRGLCVPFDSARFPYTRALEYPFENSVYQYRSLSHAVIYDSIAKGRVSVDAEPDAALLALENPYDPTARLASGAEVMFDYALFDGHYYSYFGLTPVLLFYAPFRLVTGYLPSYTTAAGFFALLTVIAAFLCVWEAVRRFVGQPTLLLLCLGAAAVALGSNALMLLSCADRYHLSIGCMQAFFFLTLWTGLVACRQKKRLRRSIWFVLCALCTFLLTWSRATGALAAAGWIIPLFLLVLLDKRHDARRKAADALSYLIPLGIGAAVIMAYNAARFGSPFEFGQAWQLTLEDIHYNRVSLRDLPQAISSYFLQGLNLSSDFPFFSPSGGNINHSGNFFYAVVNAGALTMPVTWGIFALFALPEKRRRGKRAVLLAAVLATVPLALINYGVAGVAHRYVCDLLPTLCLAGMLALADLSGRSAAEGRGAASAAACGACVLTVLIALCLAFGNYRNFISQYNPDAWLNLYRLFSLR